jgi:hypothetical protein
LNGAVQTANREIGVPQFETKVFPRTFQIQFNADAPKRSIGKMCRLRKSPSAVLAQRVEQKKCAEFLGAATRLDSMD